jgi:hypothetical protein
MEARTIVPNSDPTTGQIKTVPPKRGGVVLKTGKAGLRFGPVVTGQVAFGKDGCGY